MVFLGESLLGSKQILLFHSLLPFQFFIHSPNLCTWVDSLLQPLIVNIPGYLRDTKHILSTLENVVWQEKNIWITADVTSLYTVIPHDLSKLALTWFLDTYSGYSVDLKDCRISTIMYLLKHNYFMFDSEFYLQIAEASMGAKFPPRSLTCSWHGSKNYSFSMSLILF